MRTVCCALIVVILCGIVVASDREAGIAIYGQFPERFRPWLILAHKQEIKRLEKVAAVARSQKSKATKKSEKDGFQKVIDETKERILHIQTVNDPPFVGMTLDQCHATEKREAANRFQWEVGDIGGSNEHLKFLQILGEDSCLIQRRIGGKTVILMLRGLDTKNQVDGTDFIMNETMWVTGTHTYKTANGTNTVLVLEPFDWGKYQQTLKQ